MNLGKLIVAAERVRQARQDFERAAQAVAVLAVGRFTGRELADGQIWHRICQDCRAVQPDENPVNQPCKCGCRVILWEPRTKWQSSDTLAAKGELGY